MAPLLGSFLADLLTETTCERPTLVLDNAVTPDFLLLETVRQNEQRIQSKFKEPQRAVHRHHSQPIPRTKPWTSKKPPPASSKACSRWDSGASTSDFDGHSSDPQLIFPLRTCDDQRYDIPSNHTDRWSVSRNHSDSLISPRRSKGKLSLDSFISKSKDVPPKQATPSLDKNMPLAEMEITWRRSRPSIRRRSSTKSTLNKPKLPTVQEMEIIWEREHPSVEKEELVHPKENIHSSETKRTEISTKESQPKARTCPTLLFCHGHTAMEELLEAALLLIYDSFPPKTEMCGISLGANSHHPPPSSNHTTILNFCGGDIAPACQQLEYDMMDNMVSPLLLKRTMQASTENGTVLMDSKHQLSSVRRMSSCVTL
jgi:hypothetical protein